MTGTVVVEPLTIVEEESPDEDGDPGSLPAAGLLGTATIFFGAAIYPRKENSL